jgi:hypothetical protein
LTSGGCEILHADCIEVLQTLAENSFDALITDPPYSSGGQYRGDRMQSVTEKYSQSGAKAECLKHAFEGDNMDQRAWTSWTAYWLELCRKVVKPGGVAAIFIDWRQLPALYDAIQWGGWVVRGLIPWDKKNARRSRTVRSSNASSSCGRLTGRWTSNATPNTCLACCKGCRLRRRSGRIRRKNRSTSCASWSTSARTAAGSSTRSQEAAPRYAQRIWKASAGWVSSGTSITPKRHRKD